MQIGIDVGGMSIKAGVVDENGRIVSRAGVKSEAADGEAMVRGMYAAMLKALEAAGAPLADVTSVGIGSSGLCDNENGTVIYSGNINYDNTSVRGYFNKFTDARIDVENDANCAAIGEYVVRGGDCASLILVTLGTGVGGGIILNRRLYSGINGGAGEVGHMTLYPDGRRCGCGAKGCWEAYASVSALIRDARERGGYFASCAEIDGRTPFEAAERGVPEAVEVRDNWIRNVATGVCSLINIFQPDRLVIGGAVSKEGETLLAPIRSYVAENVYTRGVGGLRQTEISAAVSGNDAGIIGAAFLHKLL